jgi:hypothetical protein
MESKESVSADRKPRSFLDATVVDMPGTDIGEPATGYHPA